MSIAHTFSLRQQIFNFLVTCRKIFVIFMDDMYISMWVYCTYITYLYMRYIYIWDGQVEKTETSPQFRGCFEKDRRRKMKYIYICRALTVKLGAFQKQNNNPPSPLPPPSKKRAVKENHIVSMIIFVFKMYLNRIGWSVCRLKHKFLYQLWISTELFYISFFKVYLSFSLIHSLAYFLIRFMCSGGAVKVTTTVTTELIALFIRHANQPYDCCMFVCVCVHNQYFTSSYIQSDCVFFLAFI